MKFLKDRKKILRYVYDEAIGRFLGFIIAFSASGLVSRFFETRSFKNLWGITAKKKVISKEAFENYEWIASVAIGFIVLELYNKYLKDSIDKYIALAYGKVLEIARPYIPVVQDKSKAVQPKVFSEFNLKIHVFILQMRKLIANHNK